METLEYILNKYNLNITMPSPITVPGMSRGTLAYLFAELGFMKGIEIGVQAGKFSKVLCEANPKMKFWGIDPWEEYSELRIPGKQEDQDRGYEIAKSRVPINCNLIRMKSMDALPLFTDNSLDFVYVDGNHEFVYATEDIHYWLKKIRMGGIIAGHDYRRYYPRSYIHVYQVVNAFTTAYGIKPWFVTDNATEHVRSWFWVKDEHS